MARSKKPRSLQSKDAPVLQLTSHQRIVAISAILLYGALCFVAGIAATKVQQWMSERRESVAQQAEKPAEPAESITASAAPVPKEAKPSGKTASGEGRVTSPRQGVLDSAKPTASPGGTSRTLPKKDSSRMAERAVPPVTLPVKLPAPAPEKREPEAAGAGASVGSTPRVSDQKPSARKPEAGQAKPATATSRTGTTPPKVESKPKTTRLEPLAPMEPTEPRTAEARKPSAESRPDPEAKPSEQRGAAGKAQEKPAATSSAASPTATSGEAGTSAPKGGFGIQVASFGAANAAKAEEYRKQAATDTGLPARLVKSEDGKHLRVLVGTYATREAAVKAREALRKRKEFADCYVQVLR